MKKLWALSLLASVQMSLAAESFGGIGLAIYPSEFGAEIADVVKGSVAEKAGLMTGDFCFLRTESRLKEKVWNMIWKCFEEIREKISCFP